MANKRVIDLPDLSQEVQEGQYVLVDSVGGTGKMDLKHIVDEAGSFDPSGEYPELFAGNLTTDKAQEDKIPYLFRKTGGTLSRVGERCYDTIIGASVGENQLIDIMSVDGSKTESGITITDNRDGSYTVNGTATANVYLALSSIQVISGHKYFWSGTPKNGSSTTYRSYITGNVTGSIDYGEGVIYSASGTGTAYVVAVYINNGATVNNLVFRPQLIDLTALLGSSIADYIYSLETATAGAGIAKLRSWGFLRGYQAFNAGSLESVEVTGKKVVGFNQFDKSTLTEHSFLNADGTISTHPSYDSVVSDYIQVIPNQEYYFKDVWNIAQRRSLNWYDADKNLALADGIFASTGNLASGTKTAPSNAYYARIATQTSGADTCCMSISSDRNGEYEAYTSQTYALGSDKLRGIFKLDANNNLYADGDRKTSDGTITRYYGTRAYQSGDESLADAITDGTTTVYKLTTPTTEQSTPFQSPQVCYPDGTEEFITENGVPVGHETEYPYDLKGLVEELIDVPDVPSANGTYVLKATRSASGVAYNWVTG